MQNNIRFFIVIFLLHLSTGLINSIVGQDYTQGDNGGPISLKPFQSSARHWYGIYDTKNIIFAKTEQPRYKATEFINIADNMLIYQRNNGGWPKNYDMRAILTPEQIDSLEQSKDKLHTTFDNTTTYSHIEYLAKVYAITQTEKYKESCLKGIAFILDAQYSNGGWPQYYPLEEGYSRHITFNDGAYIGIMKVLEEIIDNQPYYSFIEPDLRNKIQVSFNKGLDCILKCQIKEKGKYTAWCQQHNEIDYKPAWARKFEPPSICNMESAEIVLFLMKLKNPDKKIIKSVQSAVKWFEVSKIKGIKVNEVKAPEAHFTLRVSKTDKVVVADSSAPPIWTRYYELGTHIPMFCNRDSRVVYSLAEVERERRSGYGWYTYDPQNVLTKYETWKQSLKTGKKK
jgi:PelA/Pel-15E family pectate lyase